MSCDEFTLFYYLQVYSALVLLTEVNVGRSFVEPDAEALQFFLDDLFVLQRLEHI